MHLFSIVLLAALACTVLAIPTAPPGESSLHILNDPPRIANEAPQPEISALPVIGEKPSKQVANDESSLPGSPKGLNSQPAGIDYKLPDLSGFTKKNR